MLFINAKLIMDDSILQNGYLNVTDGKITGIGTGSPLLSKGVEAFDCKGLFLSPGFVDIHSHGGGGADIMDGTPQDIITAAQTHLRHGTTTYYPTTLTSSDEALFHTFDCFREARKCHDTLPHLPGLHLEGPYFDMVEKGAQDPRYIKVPTPGHYMNILEKGEGIISRISFAPELPGALEMADRMQNSGIMLSAGHTAATYEVIRKAFDHGVRHLTHFYSGMSTIHREGGYRILGTVEAGYLIDGLSVELIADGMHLPPDLLKMILKLKNHDKICVCTDSMRGAGMPEGPSILGPKDSGQPVIIEDGIAKMPDRTCFAGSVATTDRLVRVMTYKAGLPLWEAVRMASALPARFMGIDDHTGTLSVGKDADLLLFDDDITIRKVFVDGKEVR